MLTWWAAGAVMVVAAGVETGAVVVALAEEAASSPSAVVEALDAGLLAILKDAERLGYKGRFERIVPIVGRTFDVAFMAEKAVGRYWKALSDADRERWTALFGEFTAANYAGNFDHFANQRFEVLGEEPAANATTMVRTKVVDPGREDVELTYRLHRATDGWRIIDVYLKGTVSELALRRSDYTSVLERDGFEALVTTLRGKIDDLAAGRAKRSGA